MQNNSVALPGITRYRNQHCRVCQGRETAPVLERINPLEHTEPFSLTIYSHGHFMSTPLFWLDVLFDRVEGVRTPHDARIISVSDQLAVGIHRDISDYLLKCLVRGESMPGDEIVEGRDCAVRLVHRESSDFWQCPWPVAHIIPRALP